MLSAAGAAKRRLQVLVQMHEDTLARGFLIALGLILSALLFIDPAVLLHRNFLSNRPPPDRAYVASKIHQNAGRPFDVVVIGGSSMREMVPAVGRQGIIPNGLCAKRGRLLNAATSSQHPADGYAILDALAYSPELVVVGLTGRRLIGDRRNNPYELGEQVVELPRSRSAVLDALHNGHIGFASFDFFDQLRRSQWTLQTIALSARGARWPVDPMFDNRTAYPDIPQSPKVKQTEADKLLLAADATPSHHFAPMGQYWIHFADYVTRKGGRILFVMTPVSAEASAYDAYTRQQVAGALQAISAKYPLLDLRVSQQRALSDRDFFDPLHVSHRGRDRLWPELANAIRHVQMCKIRDGDGS